MSRDIDPRFSTALREELTRRADADDADAVGERTLPARRQWIVVAVTAAVLLVVIGGLLTTVHRPAPPAIAPARTDGLVDPLSTITDPASGVLFVAPQVDPLLHATGTGPQHYRITTGAGTSSVRAYISCTPGSPYRVTIAGKWTSAQCARTFFAFADIPVRAGTHDVSVQVDDGTRFTLLVIPTPTGTTTHSTLEVTQPPIELPTGGSSGSEVFASAAGTTTGTSGRFLRSTGSVEVDVVCRGSGSVVVRVGGGSLGTPEERDACRTGTTVRSIVPAGPAFTVDGTRADWQVTPYGDVTWAVVFRSP